MRTGQEGGCHKIGKLTKGSSFGGCIRYVTGKDEAKIIASAGVLLGTNVEITQSFELQRQLNPRIKNPVGHIALSVKREGKRRFTDDFMAKIALEYMQMIGINYTQFIIVRHHNTYNPHCYIVYNPINNDGNTSCCNSPAWLVYCSISFRRGAKYTLFRNFVIFIVLCEILF